MYYITTGPDGSTVIIRMDGNIMNSFMENPENTDYQAYLAWVAEGNSPLPWPPVS